MTLEEAERIANIVNSTAGRKKDIIKVIICEECQSVFFGQPQDQRMREVKLIRTLCPTCRCEEEKNKKRLWAAANKQRN